MKDMRKVGVQLQAACVEDGDGHSKCVECHGDDVNDKEAILKARFGHKDDCNIEENQSKEVKPEETTSIEQLPLAAREHDHNHVDRQEGNLNDKECRRISRKSRKKAPS